MRLRSKKRLLKRLLLLKIKSKLMLTQRPQKKSQVTRPMLKKTPRRVKLRKRKMRRNPSTTLSASVPSVVWATTLPANTSPLAVSLPRASPCPKTLSWTRDSAQTDPLVVLSRAASLARALSEDSVAHSAALATVVHSGELKVCKKNLLCALRREKRQI